MKKIHFFFLLFFAFAAYGQQERIAIMNTVDDLDSIGFSDLSYLTDKLRDIAGKVLPKNRYGIMTQQSIVDRLGSQERMVKECKAATCLADLGRRVSADYVSQGRIGRFSGELTIKVELYSVGSGNLLSSFTGDSKDLRGLLAVLEAKAPKLFEEMHEFSVDRSKPAPPTPASAPVAAPAAAKKACSNKLNINEIVFGVQSAFPVQLKNCSAALAKNMALAASPFGKKAEQKEPKALMTECTIDGIKRELPLGADEYIKPIESFVQNLLNAASAGGSLDVKKLSGAIGGMNVNSLINELKTKAANDDCVVDEPFEPPAAVSESDSDEEDGDESALSLGIRGGLNGSYLYSDMGSYNSTVGLQLGLVFDIAASSWFHLQPGVMYIQKGMKDAQGSVLTSHYVEVPLLLSIKFSAFRINAGPYFSLCAGANYGFDSNDFGLSTGLGFDIGMFYIGMFYDYGLIATEVQSYDRYGSYYSFDIKNRTLGLNFGVNL